jgi:hypothetical protein
LRDAEEAISCCQSEINHSPSAAVISVHLPLPDGALSTFSSTARVLRCHHHKFKLATHTQNCLLLNLSLSPPTTTNKSTPPQKTRTLFLFFFVPPPLFIHLFIYYTVRPALRNSLCGLFSPKIYHHCRPSIY